mmetsp:Transcript_23445/g.48819  ORF Transcript_23445/g.48819 Transcript_23445/m.48819 type:complete len:208 (-) Transcript_23445:1703-2326(-)
MTTLGLLFPQSLGSFSSYVLLTISFSRSYFLSSCPFVLVLRRSLSFSTKILLFIFCLIVMIPLLLQFRTLKILSVIHVNTTHVSMEMTNQNGLLAIVFSTSDFIQGLLTTVQSPVSLSKKSNAIIPANMTWRIWREWAALLLCSCSSHIFLVLLSRFSLSSNIFPSETTWARSLRTSKYLCDPAIFFLRSVVLRTSWDLIPEISSLS